MNISKEVKCLIVRENNGENKVDAVPFPPEDGVLLITGSVGIYPLEHFIQEIQSVISKRSIEELLNSGFISYFINDELVYRKGQYMKVKKQDLMEGDIVIKFSLRKRRKEDDIISTPGNYWLRLGFAFTYTPRPAPAPKKGARAEGKQEVVK
ncbi:MAG: hypothetical protein ACP5IB_07750 [Thermoplasmata archaeon]